MYPLPSIHNMHQSATCIRNSTAYLLSLLAVPPDWGSMYRSSFVATTCMYHILIQVSVVRVIFGTLQPEGLMWTKANFAVSHPIPQCAVQGAGQQTQRTTNCHRGSPSAVRIHGLPLLRHSSIHRWNTQSTKTVRPTPSLIPTTFSRHSWVQPSQFTEAIIW